MEFSDVVRSRRMVRRYDPEQPVPAEALDTILRNATRAPSAGFSQGWDFVVLTEPEQREAFWAATTDPDDEPDAWLEGVQQRPGAGPVLLRRGLLPAPLRRAGQGLDRHGRGPLARAVLGHRHRHGRAADAADRGGRGPRRRCSSACRRRATRTCTRPSPSRTTAASSAWSRSATPLASAPGFPSRRPRRPLSEVVHAGRFGAPYVPA